MRVGASPESWSPPVAEPSASPSPFPHALAAKSPAPSEFSRLAGRLGRAIDNGEATVARAAHGGSGAGLGPAELLALQSGIYRYVEVVDLTTKLVDRGVGAVKTTLQSGQ